MPRPEFYSVPRLDKPAQPVAAAGLLFLTTNVKRLRGLLARAIGELLIEHKYSGSVTVTYHFRDGVPMKTETAWKEIETAEARE
jgi:hypothetical protein